MSMRKVLFVEISKSSYGRSHECLVDGAIDTCRVVAVGARPRSSVGETIDVHTDDGATFIVKGCVDDWLDLEEQHDPE